MRRRRRAPTVDAGAEDEPQTRRSGPRALAAGGGCSAGAATRPRSDRAVLVLHDVTKTYPNGKTALEDVDLIVPEGDFVFLVGPSGAGKSTLIKLLIRDELATHGAVILDGQDLARLPRRSVSMVRRKIGIVFQDFKLLPTKSVWENVSFALEVTGTPAPARSGRRSIGCWRSSG